MTLYILGFVLTFFAISLILQLTHELGLPDFKWVENDHHFQKLVTILLFCAIWPVFVFWLAISGVYKVTVKKETPRWLKIWTNQ